MMRTLRSITNGLLVLSLSLPALVDAQELAPETAIGSGPEVVAEALFLLDALPPGGRDLNFSLELAQGEPDAETGERELTAAPRLQLAVPFAEGRLGLTVDVGIGTTGAGDVLDTPGASLKLLLRSPDGGQTGFAASLDLFGSTHSFSETEAGLGLNAIRALGPVTLRAGAGLASGVRDWSPHFHGGFSGALALGARWKALAEVITEVSSGDAVVSAGPTLKVDLWQNAALMAGALFQVAPDVQRPIYMFQLTQSL